MRSVEIEHEPFNCPIIGGIVRITKKFLIDRNGGKAAEAKVFNSFDCNCKSACGVVTKRGRGSKFDLEKCAYPGCEA